MMKADFFEREIQNIESEDYRDFVRDYFNHFVGDWFFETGASASGKYHPEFTKGIGGLVRHTRAVEWICEELLRMSTYAYMTDEYKDYARMACLLHDTCKYGWQDENHNCYKNHGAIAADNVNSAWFELFGEKAPELLCMAIRSHMGQWTENKDDRPFTNIDRLVHMADYIASRSFWDIPALTDQYQEDAERFHAEDDLPF